MVQFRLLFPELRHFEKNGTHHVSLIGRHLESVGRTEAVFEFILALSEKTAGQRMSVRFGHFLSGYRVNVTSCNLCARTKIEQNPSLVKLVEGF